MAYCDSRHQTIRRRTSEVMIGDVGVGAGHPIRIQSMTTSDTQDVAATVDQCVALAEAGCEIIRITAPNVAAARCLRDIRRELQKRRIYAPLVADIHFLPSAALEAVEHVDKVRINPGNYADRKKFAVREYSDSQYNEELERLHEAFTPLVKRARTLGRSMRIGTNHGSLSDRIMNRYGDTPLGMVESALEFLRIAESHDYRQIVLSMKASNPKIMIQAYRLLVERMALEDMHYPLHLGVTEAGDGEDGRIKSAIGIGSLLLDGLGDTIRVSLTEDSVYEIPVARAIADKAMILWQGPATPDGLTADSIDPYLFARRPVDDVDPGHGHTIGTAHPPRVIAPLTPALSDPAAWSRQIGPVLARLRDTPAEGVCLTVAPDSDIGALNSLLATCHAHRLFPILDSGGDVDWQPLLSSLAASVRHSVILLRRFEPAEGPQLQAFLEAVTRAGCRAALEVEPWSVASLAPVLQDHPSICVFVTAVQASRGASSRHQTGRYRMLAETLRQTGLALPIWIRATAQTSIQRDESFLSRLIEGSLLTGSLLCDGIGDLISFEDETDFSRSVKVAYNLLQGAGARISKTEFVACPSCGRTLFDLQTTTRRIREKTSHLKGVKIAIMGCIVNGPGEMADADFGYVGGAPGKINLYVGKECVQFHIPSAEADQRLIDLIKEHGKWIEPEPEPAHNE